MAKFYNEDGTEVEGFTKEELDAKLKEQQEVQAKKNADKEVNVNKLREEKEAAEKLAKETREALDGKDKEFAEKEQKKERDTAVNKLAGNDVELKEKIQHHMDRFKDEIKTPEDFQRILSDSYVLATGNQVPDKLQEVISSAGSKGGKDGGGAKLPISADAMVVAQKMGMTEEEIIKANK